jgi:hypothetical protein
MCRLLLGANTDLKDEYNNLPAGQLLEAALRCSHIYVDTPARLPLTSTSHPPLLHQTESVHVTPRTLEAGESVNALLLLISPYLHGVCNSQISGVKRQSMQ